MSPLTPTKGEQREADDDETRVMIPTPPAD